MNLSVRGRDEPFITVLTHEWLLPSVPSVMDLQQKTLSEALPTDRTGV